MDRSEAIYALRSRFAALLDYSANDPTNAIDPVTWKSPEGDTCLHVAALRGDDESVNLLIDLGVDVNALGDMSNTALHYARRGKHQSVMQTLLRRGADPGLVNEFGEAAISE